MTEQPPQSDTCQAPSGTDTPAPVGVDVKEQCFQLREEIEGIKKRTIRLRSDSGIISGSDSGIISGEAVANIVLAYRHLEDARMRLGKAVQAVDGGESCYPR